MIAGIDIETTGLIAGKHEIVQLAIVIVDKEFNFVEKFISNIKPMREEVIDVEAMDINGLNLYDLNNAPTPLQVRSAFFQWQDEMYSEKKLFLLGHNLSFDIPFLKLFFGEDNFKSRFDYHTRDTVAVAQYLMDVGKLTHIPLRLTDLCDYFNIPLKAHTAEGDVLATILLYKALMEVLNENDNT